MSSRILLLSADFGSGHLAAAKAIAALCRDLNPACEAEPVQVRSPLLNLVSWGYLRLIDWAPSLYRRLYQMPVGSGLRTFVRLVLGRAVRREIRRLQPHVIVGTHPFPAGVAAWLRHTGQLEVPVVMALTDFMPHGFWLHDGVDRYCVSSESAAAELVRMGVEPGRIAVTGVAIRPEFARAGHPTREAPGQGADRRVLVMGGGLGLGPIVEAVRALAALPQPDLRVTVVCGSNRPLEHQLRDLFGADARIRVVGFTQQVADLMRESHLLVTKPGGITCSEAMALALPMLLLSPLPGHEEENAAFLVRTGAALITDEHRIGEQVTRLLFTPGDALSRMAQKARAAGQPRAAQAIANEILTLSAKNPHLDTTLC
ncbi:MAG: MGDG synthase family glycosyltransferase [Bacillota bacterium]